MKRFDVGVLAIAVAVLTLLGCAKGVADGAGTGEIFVVEMLGTWTVDS